jgi:hypothetical protein
MYPNIKRLIGIRNLLRRQVKTKRSGWIEERRELRVAQEEAKLEAWSSFVETLEVDEDVNKAWRVIKSLDGTPTSFAPNEALCHKGKTSLPTKLKRMFSPITMPA